MFSQFFDDFQIILAIILIFLELNPFNGRFWNFFHEIQVFYLDSSCLKLSPGFSLKFLEFLGYIFFGVLKYLSRLF